MDSQMHSFSWNHHRQTFFKTVYNLRKQEIFCDITLACDGVLFPAHRLVLAMCSEYFNEILTKVACQQPMVVLVPTVSAADLEALLTYIYQGEIRLFRDNLPSLMKAAETLKIKGLCNGSNSHLMEQCVKETDLGKKKKKNAKKRSRINVGGESDSLDSIICVPPDCSFEQKAHKTKYSHPLPTNQLAFQQVEVFIDDEEEKSQDMIYEEQKQEEEEVEVEESAYPKEQDEDDLDPLNVPLLPFFPLTFTPADSSQPLTPSVQAILPWEMPFSEDSDQDQTFNFVSIATPTSSNFRYTKEQKVQIVKYYHTHGPTKAAKLMTEHLGRKVNESSIRSVFRAWMRGQKIDEHSFM